MLKQSTLKAVLAATVAVSVVSLAQQQAQAGQLYNGWNYSIDSFSDGSGGSSYEIKGLAIKETDTTVYVALTGGMPLGGTMYGSTHIGWGDLFFNFSGQNFKSASDSQSLFGVRFANYDGANGLQTGVYKGVSAKSVTTQHAGYSSLQQYYNSGFDKANTQGDLATKQQVYDYYNPGQPSASILNVINSSSVGAGERLGDVTILNNLAGLGLDFGHFSAAGSQTVAFSFSKEGFGSGNYVSNIFLECGNDGVAIKGDLKKAPEPSAMAGLALVGVAASRVLKRRKVANA